MTRPPFEELTVLSRFWESSAGCTECCQDAAGEKHVRICMDQTDLQKSVLLHLWEATAVRLNGTRLELLFPWQEGKGLDEWIFTQQPDLRQRRNMCFSLLEQMLTAHFPVELTALSARVENLRFTAEHVELLLLPRLSDWTCHTGEPEAVRGIAALMAEILNRKLLYRADEILAPELELFLMRSASGEYRSWDQLQSDLFRIPEQLPPRPKPLEVLKKKLRVERLKSWIPVIQRIIAAVLVLLALVSVFFALLRWRNKERMGDWPGLPVIGQEILQEEDGT